MIDQLEIRRKLFGAGVSANSSLWLNKYVQDQRRDESESRLKVMKEVVEYFPEPGIYRAAYARWKKLLREEYHAQMRRAEVKGRMIVGLGSESVLETSICLHRTYGIPYIPGSALKGLAASYAHQRLSEEWHKGGELHTIVFGDTDDAGYITFFDAWYQPGTGFAGKALHTDVITVHHPQYYQGGGNAPSDTDDPNPVPFLSATGTYLLALAAPAFQGPTRWIDITFQILAEALEHFGIGAKTSSGYGRMLLLGQPVESLNPGIGKTEETKKLASVPYIRPNIPRFTPGQGISGRVIAPTDELRQMIFEAQAVLCYREFSTKLVLIVVNGEEAISWTPGQIKNCLFVREEERYGCTVLICLPGVKKEKKKK